MARIGCDLTGQTFNEFTVLGIGRKARARYWLCRCNCGIEKELRQDHLINGHQKDCGHKWRVSSEDGAVGQLYATYRHGAERRSLSFTLTKEEFKKLILLPCAYCGIKPNQKFKSTRGDYEIMYNGVDRFDNYEGYHVDNVLSCCKFCNRAKNDMTTEEWFYWLDNLVKHSRERYQNGLRPKL